MIDSRWMSCQLSWPATWQVSAHVHSSHAFSINRLIRSSSLPPRWNCTCAWCLMPVPTTLLRTALNAALAKSESRTSWRARFRSSLRLFLISLSALVPRLIQSDVSRLLATAAYARLRFALRSCALRRSFWTLETRPKPKKAIR